MSQFCPKCKHNNADNSKFCTTCVTQLIGLLGCDSVLHNRYLIKDLLGTGGMGAVYLAEDERFKDAKVAIKENFEVDSLRVELFKNEAEVLRRLSHPNLPKVFDHFFERSGKQYLVMEYIDGEDLQKILKRQGPIAENQVLDWGSKLLETLDYLHTQPKPILHRDIKPSNIKIALDGRLVLVDFGLAKAYTGGIGESRTMKLGTEGYAPPEQTSDTEKTTPCSDLYSVGATLYHLLSGKLPPSAGNRAAGTLEQPLRKLMPEISAKTEAFVQKAMSVPRADRFQSATAMRQAVLEAQQKTGHFNIARLAPRPSNRFDNVFMALGLGIIIIGIALLWGNGLPANTASPASTALPQAGSVQLTPTLLLATATEMLSAASPTPQNEPTATTHPTATASLAPSPSPSSTLTPRTPTATATATATKATLTETSMPTPTLTRTRTSTPTRTRMPTAIPEVSTPVPFATPALVAAVPSLSSPQLLSPSSGANFSGLPGPTFSWTSAGNLGAFDYYQFQIQHSQGPDIICTKITSIQARSYVPSLRPSWWTVNVVRLGSAISDGAACSGNIVASAGEERSLSWTQNSSPPSNSGSSNPTPRPNQAQPPVPPPQPTSTPNGCVSEVNRRC